MHVSVCKAQDVGISLTTAPTIGLYAQAITQPSIQRVQALADISRSAVYAFAVYKAIS